MQTATQSTPEHFEDAFNNQESSDRDLSVNKDQSIEWISSRLPIRHAIRLGSNNLKLKPFRMVLMILLTLVAFTLFGIVDSVGSYNRLDNTVESIIDNEINYLSISKRVKRDVVELDRFNREDLNSLSQQLNVSIRGVGYVDYNNFRWYNHIPYTIEPEYYQAKRLNFDIGLIELNETELSDFGFTLIGGRMPVTSNEVAITKYIFEHFENFGYINYSTGLYLKPDDITSIDQFLALKPSLVMNRQLYTITGVIDTKFNSKRYEPLKNVKRELSFTEDYLRSELYALIDFSVHTAIFCGPNIVVHDPNSDTYFRLDGSTVYIYENPIELNLLSMVRLVHNFKNYNHPILLFEQDSPLKRNEILINAELLIDRESGSVKYFDQLDVNVKPEHIPPITENFTF